jgi:hypothetical protein
MLVARDLLVRVRQFNLANGIRASRCRYSTRSLAWEPFSDPFGGILEPFGGVLEASGMAFICSVAAAISLILLALVNF